MLDKIDEVRNTLIINGDFNLVANLEEYIERLSNVTGIYCIRVSENQNKLFNNEIEELFITRKNPILYIGISYTSTLKKGSYRN